MDKIHFLNSNFIYSILLAVKYSKDVVSTLKRVIDSSSYCTIVRKRCRALLAKMENPEMGSQAIGSWMPCFHPCGLHLQSMVQGPLYLPTGAGRNRFNLLGAIDPFSLELIHSHSMVYVDSQQVRDFLEKVRNKSGDIPVSIMQDSTQRSAQSQACLSYSEEQGEWAKPTCDPHVRSETL